MSSIKKARPIRLERSHHGLAMVEIIIAIGVLAVVSMFIVEMFVRATNLENKARDLDRAVAAAQTVIEEAKAFGAPSGALHFDAAWRPIAEPDPRGYSLTASEAHDGAVRRITVVVVKNQRYLLESEEVPVIYTLEGAARETEASR